MCLAIPAKVISQKGENAQVDFGDGITRDVDTSLVDVKPGEYVIVHAGFAIEVLSKEDAEETLQLWREILNST